MGNRALQLIVETRIIAIVRATSPEHLIDAAAALRDGGVRVLEISLTTPQALAVIAKLAALDVLAVGAGTVLDPESARLAIVHGAQFIVCPTLSLPTIELCRRYSIPVVPGAYTPTEILNAWEAGAELVKVFPSDVAGPAYIKAIKAPLPQVRLAAVGGVEPGTAAAYLKAGADVLGIGSSLINQLLLDQGDFTEIERRARLFTGIVAETYATDPGGVT